MCAENYHFERRVAEATNYTSLNYANRQLSTCIYSESNLRLWAHHSGAKRDHNFPDKTVHSQSSVTHPWCQKNVKARGRSNEFTYSIGWAINRPISIVAADGDLNHRMMAESQVRFVDAYTFTGRLDENRRIRHWNLIDMVKGLHNASCMQSGYQKL